MGRRCFKMVTVNGIVTLHQRYLYRGYLQIACIDLTRSHHPGLWLITWDPTQPIATRPLAIQKDGTWYTYGLDLTKNVREVFGSTGYINTAYTYSPYGSVIATNLHTQPIQWSSEIMDSELNMVYYNWRYYNPLSGRWNQKDMKYSINLYCLSNPSIYFDIKGLKPDINYFGDKKAKDRRFTERQLVDLCINEPDYFVISTHGLKHQVEKGNQLIYPKELLQDILKAGYKFDKPIKLLACSTGKKGGFAEKLAALLDEKWKHTSPETYCNQTLALYAPDIDVILMHNPHMKTYEIMKKAFFPVIEVTESIEQLNDGSYFNRLDLEVTEPEYIPYSLKKFEFGGGKKLKTKSTH